MCWACSYNLLVIKGLCNYFGIIFFWLIFYSVTSKIKTNLRIQCCIDVFVNVCKFGNKIDLWDNSLCEPVCVHGPLLFTSVVHDKKNITFQVIFEIIWNLSEGQALKYTEPIFCFRVWYVGYASFGKTQIGRAGDREQEKLPGWRTNVW